MKRVLFFALSICGLFAFAAENLIKNGDAASGVSPMKGLEITDKGPEGAKCFVANGTGRIFLGNEYIEIEPDAAYEISAELCGEGDSQANRVDFGLALYDGKKQLIAHSQMAVVPGSNAVLLEAIPKGAKSLKVKDAGDWETLVKRGARIIAMNAKDDYSDLPNRTLCYFIKKLTQEGDIISIELTNEAYYGYPAGTKVRLHRDGGYQWSLLEFHAMGNKWKTFKGSISGMAASGTPKNQFWKNAKYVRLAMGTRKDQKVYVNKISLTRVDEVPEGMVSSSKTLITAGDASIITTPIASWPRRRFVQKADGTLVIEAECPWDFTSAKLDAASVCVDNGCGNGGYIRHVKNAFYPIKLDKGGTYQIFYRQKIPFAAEWCHTRVLDGLSVRITDSSPANFVEYADWNWHATKALELKAGEHTLNMDFQGGPMLDQIAIIPVGKQLEPKDKAPLTAQFASEGLSGEAVYGGFMAGPRYSNAVLSYKTFGKGAVKVSASLDKGAKWFPVASGDKLPDCKQNTELLVKVAMDSKSPAELPVIENLKVDYLVSTELPPEKSRIDKAMEASTGKLELQPAKWNGLRWKGDALCFSNPLTPDKNGAIFARITDADNMVLAPAERSWLEKDDRLGGATVLHQGRLNSNLVAFDFTIAKTGKYRPYFLMRTHIPSTAIIMEFNRPENAYMKYGYSIDNKKTDINGAGSGAPGHRGAYYRGEYYWCGGNPVELTAGGHCLRLLWGMHYMNCAAIALVPEGEKAKAPEPVAMPKTSVRRASTKAVVDYAEVSGRLLSVSCEDSKVKCSFEISFDGGKTFNALPKLPLKSSRAFIIRARFEGQGAIPKVTANVATSEAIAVADKDQKMLFDRITGNLQGYFLANGTAIMPESCNLPLFNFQIGTKKNGYRQVAPEAGNLVERASRKEGKKQILELKYALCNEQVTATVKLTLEDGQIPYWELTVDNASKEDIRHITFPVFRDMHLTNEPENGYYTAIRNLCAFGWPGAALGGREMHDGTWPGSYSMGYAEFYAKGIGSFTIQNRNPDGIGVNFTLKPNAGGSALRLATTRHYMVEAGKSATVKYAAGFFKGNEHDACRRYGDWAHTWMDFSQVNRPVAKNVTACTQGAYYPLERTENQMIPIYRWMGYDMHWLVSGKIGYTHLYCPNYGTPEQVAAQHLALAAAGQPAVQYWDHYGWSFKYETEPTLVGFPKEKIPFIETFAKPGFAEKAANRNEFGRFCTWGYAAPDCTMCTASHEWTDYAQSIMFNHYFKKYKVSIYADESCVYVPCYNTAHDHGKQYGMKMVGLGKLFTKVHELARKEGGDCIINGEGCPDYLLQFEEMGLRSGPDALDGAPLLYAFPEVKFFRGEANHPIDGVPIWDEAMREYHLIARSDVPVFAGNSRHFIHHRQRIRDWMYNGVFKDNVGLEPSCVGIIAKYFLRNDKDYCGILVNIRNEESRAGAKLRFRRDVLPANAVLPVNALAYLMEGEAVEPVAIESGSDYFSVNVPSDRASSILIPVKMPKAELVRTDVIWPQRKGQDVLCVTLMNFGEARANVPLKITVPKGMKVEGLPASITLRGGEFRRLELPMFGRESLITMASITLEANGIKKTELVIPTVCNTSFERHTGKTMAADNWGTNPQYFVHAMQQMDQSVLEKEALGGILDGSKPYKGSFSLRLPGHSVPMPWPVTIAGPYGRFNYPKEKALLPWFYNAQQFVVLKPDTKYHLSFALRFAKDDGEMKLQPFGYSERTGQVALTFKPVTYKPKAGDREWSVKELDFRTPSKIFNCTQTPVCFVNLGASDVWVDEVIVTEVKD